jgi:tripartite-type tricarboxylate transporter receptor subunit TctC
VFIGLWAIRALAPAGTPAAVIGRLNAAINDSLQSSEMKASLARLGYEAKMMMPGEFADFLEVERQKWPPLLDAAGLKAQ